MLTQDQKQFLEKYTGGSSMLKGMRGKMERGENDFSDFSMKYLNTAMENAKLGGSVSKEITSPVIIDVDSSPVDLGNDSLVTFEPLEETSPVKSETPLMDGIEEYLEKIASNVVEQTMRRANKEINALKAQINQVATGRQVMHVRVNNSDIKKLSSSAHPKLAEIIQAMKINKPCGLWPWLVGPSGSGKTVLAQQIAEALGLPFSSISYSAGASEAYLVGRHTPNGFMEMPFAKFFENGGVFLGDEKASMDSNLGVFLNSALSNGFFTNPMTGKEIKMHENFYYIAADNTFGTGANAKFTGRNRLDQSTLKRFFYIEIDYNEKLEFALGQNDSLVKKLHAARKELLKRNADQAITTRDINAICAMVRNGFKEEKAIEEIVLPWPKGLAKEIGLLTSASDLGF